MSRRKTVLRKVTRDADAEAKRKRDQRAREKNGQAHLDVVCDALSAQTVADALHCKIGSTKKEIEHAIGAAISVLALSDDVIAECKQMSAKAYDRFMYDFILGKLPFCSIRWKNDGTIETSNEKKPMIIKMSAKEFEQFQTTMNMNGYCTMSRIDDGPWEIKNGGDSHADSSRKE